jgi:hypothetical protein
VHCSAAFNRWRACAARNTLSVAMPRPHVEFIHAQQLPWGAAPFADAPWCGLAAKLLSQDSSSGACSLLLRLPPGFRAPATPDARALELYVLDGAAAIDARPLPLDGYADCGAGAFAAPLESATGAVLLAFAGSRDPAASRATMRVIDTHNTPWTRHDIDPSVQFLNLSHKVLRHDPIRGDKTLLLSTGAQTHPRDWREAQLLHDCAEEMYLLGGDIIGERGTMYEGAYFWRPPGRWHGPFGSRRGSLSLIRFAEGQHRNVWSEHALPFTLTPAHAPELPQEVAAVAAAPWNPARY